MANINHVGNTIIVPPFSLTASRYDESTLWGRYQHMLDVIDPRTLLVSDSEVNRALRLLDEYKRGSIPPHVTDADLWRARKVKEAILHPDTNESIPMPFRMSGFVPFGTPIVVGMLLPGQTVLSTMFWQWLNQSHNAAVNYCNRNATNPTPTDVFLTGYVGAIASAMTIAGGLTSLIPRLPLLSVGVKSFLLRFVPFPAVATANVCNVVLMRMNELKEGIIVKAPDGTELGSSRIAAQQAIQETALTRVVLPMPILILPPIIMSWAERTSLLRKLPILRLPVQATVCTAAFGFALPLAISLFPQFGELPVSNLEPEFQQKRDKSGQFVTIVTYNKGL